MMKTTKIKKEPNPELLRKKQLLIEKFCKTENLDWAKEMRTLGMLLKKEPLEFWQFIVLGFKLNSLFWFYSENGKKEIAKYKKIYKAMQVAPPVEVKNDNEYVRSTEKKKTLIERLK